MVAVSSRPSIQLSMIVASSRRQQIAILVVFVKTGAFSTF
jgi:hypothetical protein